VSDTGSAQCWASSLRWVATDSKQLYTLFFGKVPSHLTLLEQNNNSCDMEHLDFKLIAISQGRGGSHGRDRMALPVQSVPITT
jgi:hypothetical protein